MDLTKETTQSGKTNKTKNYDISFVGGTYTVSTLVFNLTEVKMSGYTYGDTIVDIKELISIGTYGKNLDLTDAMDQLWSGELLTWGYEGYLSLRFTGRENNGSLYGADNTNLVPPTNAGSYTLAIVAADSKTFR